jgi:hypothetical protein
VPDDLCPKCKHPKKDHVKNLFQTRCYGKDWHDESTYECGCEEAFEDNAAPASVAADWPVVNV